MAQISRPWQYGAGDGIGTAPDGSYSAEDWDTIFEEAVGIGANYGVLWGVGNNLIVAATAPASNQVTIATGGAFVHGKKYENTTLVTFPAAGFPAPAGATRIDRVVLRADWATRTVRITRLAGAEGAGVPPALTQVDGVTWDVPLAAVTCNFPFVSITAFDITDERARIEARQREFEAIVGGRPGDYATLTAALADGHHSIFVRSGTYNEPAGITLRSGYHIVGESRYDSYINMGANQIQVTTGAPNYSNRTVIENLRLGSTDVNGAVRFLRSLDCTIRDCYFSGSYAITSTGGTTRLTVQNNLIVNVPAGQTGYFADGGEGHLVEGNHITGGGSGIFIANATHVRIAHNHVRDAGVAATAAIQVSGVGRENVIQGNTISLCSGDGIVVDSPYTVVIGNTISFMDENGIELAGDADMSVCNGNTISDCDGSGILLNVDVSHCIASGNQVSLCATGITVDGPTNNINDNNIFGANPGDGIVFSATADYCVCNGNMITGCGGDGIDIAAGCDQIIVDGNYCRGNTGWGIDYAGDREIVTSNICLNNVAGQIDPTGATNQVQANNIVA